MDRKIHIYPNCKFFPILNATEYHPDETFLPAGGGGISRENDRIYPVTTISTGQTPSAHEHLVTDEGNNWGMST